MQAKTYYPAGLRELRSVRAESKNLFVFAGLLSVFVNLLMLTGPLFMLQIYDRVLGSRSEETLVALSVLVALLFVVMGVLDWARSRIMARVGAQFQSRLDDRIFSAVLKKSVRSHSSAPPASDLHDLEGVQRFLASPVLFAIFDMPWTPFFAWVIFAFHPWLGTMALIGGGVLILLTFLNQWVTRTKVQESNFTASIADRFATDLQNDTEVVMGLGMRQAVLSRWRKLRTEALGKSVTANDRTGIFATLTKTFRMMLQSAMLGLGAYLVLQHELTAGAMIAASILLGRSLAPVELALNNWPVAQRAFSGWRNLSQTLEEHPESPPKTDLPKPKAHLLAQNILVLPPGEDSPSLRGVSFEVKPGQAMGVIGQSASGKSSLARVITGIWQVHSGRVSLDGASLVQYDADTLGQYVGYLPQSVTLFRASIAENIARMSENPDPEQVVEAARKAGAHEMIKAQAEGYDTIVTNDGRLSGGQRQQIGLARALYGDPVLLVLDEPNSNLDNTGTTALNSAIRDMKAAGKSVIIMAHRPAAIAECDTLLVLDGGVAKAFGPRDEVLKAQVQNVAQIRPEMRSGGVS